MQSLIESFMTRLWSEGSPKNTLTAYQHDLDEFASYITDQDIEFEALDLRHIGGFAMEMKLSGLADTTIHRRLACLKSFLRCSGMSIGEMIELPRRWRRIPRILTIGAVDQLIDSPMIGADRFGTGPRDRAVMSLLYSSGLRASEVVSLRSGDVDLDGGFVRVFGKGSVERIVPVGSKARTAIREFVAAKPKGSSPRKTDKLFPSRTGRDIERVAIWRIVKKHAGRLGLKASPHTLRHTFATHLHAGGCDVRVIQTMLGHADIATTQIYTQVDVGHLKEVHRRCFPRQ